MFGDAVRPGAPGRELDPLGIDIGQREADLGVRDRQELLGQPESAADGEHGLDRRERPSILERRDEVHMAVQRPRRAGEHLSEEAGRRRGPLRVAQTGPGAASDALVEQVGCRHCADLRALEDADRAEAPLEVVLHEARGEVVDLVGRRAGGLGERCRQPTAEDVLEQHHGTG